ncbi:MAG: 5'-methylthioadenosine/adenosylhomocysteine nucleosidase [Clostridia bacterium]|nr:5'-methylthioadenosine/adenosylhomocysteine nucleosidase [Clostridia bacterium]
MKIGIIAALKAEAELIKERMTHKREGVVGSVHYVTGKIGRNDVVLAVCGVGKVWAAICAEAMILRFLPDIIINTGVAGTLTEELSIGDLAVSSSVCHHDFDTTALGDAPGAVLIPGVEGAHIPADKKTAERIAAIAREAGVRTVVGPIASGDQFICDPKRKAGIVSTFSAVACEMEGAAVGHVCTANGVPFCVVRAISDNADGDAPENFPEFVIETAIMSSGVVFKFIETF